MIVYVETNFILEIAFQQEEHQSCEMLVNLSELNQIDLVVPAFSIAEPYDTWTRRFRRRIELRKQLESELGQISRSIPYTERVGEIEEITKLLETSSEDEKRRLDVTLSRILDTAEIIPFNSELIRSAIRFQSELALSPQDSIIYASVIRHLSSSGKDTKCFLNKNSKDFLTPDIQDQLSAYECHLITRFEHGLQFIESQLKDSNALK